jgi:predicted PurR-regulated permease PerM
VDSFSTYIRAEALLMVLLGAITFVGLMILSVLVDSRIAGYALFLAVVAAFSELIPSFGPIIALVPALLFTASLGPTPLVAVLLLYLVIMFVEGNVLVPRIEGGRFELHPAIVIVLVLGGLALLGPLGAILAMPVASAGRDVFRYAFARASGMPEPVVDEAGRVMSGSLPVGAPEVPGPVEPVPAEADAAP